MKRRRVNLLSCVIVVVLLMTSFSPVLAKDDNAYTIDMKQVQEDWEKAAKVPVEQDKGLENSRNIGIEAYGTYSTRK